MGVGKKKTHYVRSCTKSGYIISGLSCSTGRGQNWIKTPEHAASYILHLDRSNALQNKYALLMPLAEC